MKRAFAALAISLVLSLAAALEYAIVLQLTIDIPLMQGWFLWDILGATILALIVWPIATVIAWPTHLRKTTTITSLAVLGFVGVATPMNEAVGIFGSVIVGLVALVSCRLTHEWQKKHNKELRMANKAL